MNDRSFRVHQWWSITISKRPVSSKNRLNLYGHSRNAVHSFFVSFSFLYFFPFCNLISILRKQIIMYVGMYRAACRHVLCHFEYPTRTLCTLQLGWAASANAVSADWKTWDLFLFMTPVMLAATSVASTHVALWTETVERKAEAEHPFWVVDRVDFWPIYF